MKRPVDLDPVMCLQAPLKGCQFTKNTNLTLRQINFRKTL